METLQNLLSHKSIRKYTSQKIEKKLLDELLEAGMRGANTGNMQLYSIVVTENEENRKALCKLHFGQKIVENAPVVLTICADINRFHKWCAERNTGKAYDNFLWFLSATIDAAIVTQNITVAAEDKGLGTCYLGTVNYNTPEISQLLNLPKGVIPVTCITLGYPDENPDMTDRLPANGIVHYETYKDYTPLNIEQLFAAKEALPESKKFVEINQLENLAQVFTQKRYTKESSVAVSQKLLTFLNEQEFMNS